jgi:hypothetical protein
MVLTTPIRRAFDTVIGVEVIGQEDEKGLKLLGEYPPYIIYQPFGTRHDNASAGHLNQAMPALGPQR